LLATVATATATPLAAQWLYLPTGGVPRLADGSPDLEAPAPRTREGRPDFAGIWVSGALLPEGCGGACIEQMPLPAAANEPGPDHRAHASPKLRHTRDRGHRRRSGRLHAAVDGAPRANDRLDTEIMDQICLENEKSVRNIDP
jgi:hypothetical protein